MGEPDVGGAVHQHRIAGGRKTGQGRNHAAQHAVLIPDAVPGEQGRVGPVAPHLPADDGIVVFAAGVKVAEGRVLRPGNDGLGHGGHGGEVHIRHPHGDGVKTGPGRSRGHAAGQAQPVHGDGIPAVPVHQGSKIILHRVCFLSGGDHRLLRHYSTNHPGKTAAPRSCARQTTKRGGAAPMCRPAPFCGSLCLQRLSNRISAIISTGSGPTASMPWPSPSPVKVTSPAVTVRTVPLSL